MSSRDCAEIALRRIPAACHRNLPISGSANPTKAHAPCHLLRIEGKHQPSPPVPRGAAGEVFCLLRMDTRGVRMCSSSTTSGRSNSSAQRVPGLRVVDSPISAGHTELLRLSRRLPELRNRPCALPTPCTRREEPARQHLRISLVSDVAAGVAAYCSRTYIAECFSRESVSRSSSSGDYRGVRGFTRWGAASAAALGSLGWTGPTIRIAT